MPSMPPYHTLLRYTHTGRLPTHPEVYPHREAYTHPEVYTLRYTPTVVHPEVYTMVHTHRGTP